jgi:hypothetical protein
MNFDSDDDSDPIIKNIETIFENFKELGLENAYIEITQESHSYPYEFYIMNEAKQCIAGTMSLKSDKAIHIQDVRQCGGNNISLLLTFLKKIGTEYRAPIIIEDSSKFEFENVEFGKDVSIELKKLYTLSEGRTYYDKYLNPRKARLPYYEYPITFFEENRDKFTPLQYSKIEMLCDPDIETIGDFFMKIRELLKTISRNGDGVKLVENKNWDMVLFCKDVVDKTYYILSNNILSKRGGKSRKSRKSRKHKSGKQKIDFYSNQLYLKR